MVPCAPLVTSIHRRLHAPSRSVAVAILPPSGDQLRTQT